MGGWRRRRGVRFGEGSKFVGSQTHTDIFFKLAKRALSREKVLESEDDSGERALEAWLGAGRSGIRSDDALVDPSYHHGSDRSRAGKEAPPVLAAGVPFSCSVAKVCSGGHSVPSGRRHRVSPVPGCIARRRGDPC